MPETIRDTHVTPPKFLREGEWDAYPNPPWPRADKKNVTVLFAYVERRKSYFLKAYLERNGYNYIDMGDHVKEDVSWGKQYGNRMQCNPLYFTSGMLIRNLMKIHKETGLSKEEVVKKYVFLGGGGQCGPCRYGMYPQEYLKVVNDAGFKNFRILIFSSDIGDASLPKGSALSFHLIFRINMLVGVLLADFMHMAECALRSYAKDKEHALAVIDEAEKMLYDAFVKKTWFFTVPRALTKVGKMLGAIPRHETRLPLIFVTGEFFANLAHNEGNYNLRRFIADNGCEVLPGLMTQRILYDNWRRVEEAKRGMQYANTKKERTMFKRSLRKQHTSSAVIMWFWNRYVKALNPDAFGGRYHLMDLDELATLGEEYYHPHIFGGESNLEVAEAVHYADKVHGFISSKPFGCMPSSGVSDGVQAKIMSLYPNLNFLSIETSGDNEVSILSRVSMLLFKAKQKLAKELERGANNENG